MHILAVVWRWDACLTLGRNFSLLAFMHRHMQAWEVGQLQSCGNVTVILPEDYTSSFAIMLKIRPFRPCIYMQAGKPGHNLCAVLMLLFICSDGTLWQSFRVLEKVTACTLYIFNQSEYFGRKSTQTQWWWERQVPMILVTSRRTRELEIMLMLEPLWSSVVTKASAAFSIWDAKFEITYIFQIILDLFLSHLLLDSISVLFWLFFHWENRSRNQIIFWKLKMSWAGT